MSEARFGQILGAISLEGHSILSRRAGRTKRREPSFRRVGTLLICRLFLPLQAEHRYSSLLYFDMVLAHRNFAVSF